MKEVIEMTETMVNGVKFKVWSDFIARCTFAENEDGDARIIKSAGYISNDLTIRKAIALAYNLPTFRKNAKKAVAENATATAESDTEVEQNVETAEQIQAEEQKTEFKKEVITMTNKKLFKDAGSKGAYIDKLREKYPFRICRTSEPQFEAVLKDVQPLNDGDEIPIYRFPGGECCEDPFDVGTTIIEW